MQLRLVLLGLVLSCQLLLPSGFDSLVVALGYHRFFYLLSGQDFILFSPSVIAMASTMAHFKFVFFCHQCGINGMSFRGVTIVPQPAYEDVMTVFDDRATFQMPDQFVVYVLSPYGRVLSVKSISIRGFAGILNPGLVWCLWFFQRPFLLKCVWQGSNFPLFHV